MNDAKALLKPCELLCNGDDPTCICVDIDAHLPPQKPNPHHSFYNQIVCRKCGWRTMRKEEKPFGFCKKCGNAMEHAVSKSAADAIPDAEQPPREGLQAKMDYDMLKSQVDALATNPTAVHLNMLRGTIARITFDQWLHVASSEQREEFERRYVTMDKLTTAQRENESLRVALEHCDPGPEYEDDGGHGGRIACELTWADVRAIRKALSGQPTTAAPKLSWPQDEPTRHAFMTGFASGELWCAHKGANYSDAWEAYKAQQELRGALPAVTKEGLADRMRDAVHGIVPAEHVFDTNPRRLDTARKALAAYDAHTPKQPT